MTKRDKKGEFYRDFQEILESGQGEKYHGKEN